MTGQTGADSTRQIHGTSTVRISDWASASVFHQGPRLRAANRGRMYGSNLYPVVLKREKTLGNKGASMYGPPSKSPPWAAIPSPTTLRKVRILAVSLRSL